MKLVQLLANYLYIVYWLKSVPKKCSYNLCIQSFNVLVPGSHNKSGPFGSRKFQLGPTEV